MRFFVATGRHRFRPVLAAVLAGAALVGAGDISASADHGTTGFQSFAAAKQFASSYSPEQIATAYDFAPLYQQGIDGAGQSVALIETGHVSAGDLQQFDQQFNLPAPTIREYYVGGKKFRTSADGETALDVEWLHALAPRATIQIYYLNTNQVNRAGWKAMGSAIRMAMSNGARTVSISMGTCGTSPGYEATKSALTAARKAGVSVFVASGDSGDRPGPVRECGRQVGVAYPASDPSVVAVGGTSLQLNDDNTIASEIAWNLSGGGLVKQFMRPKWQVAPGLPSDTSRGVPDVAFVADPETGVALYYNGRWRQGGGTSLGAPAWAAAWALISEGAQHAGKTVKAAPRLLYGVANTPNYATNFHNITSGSNGTYSAGPGWNPVTGLGTPDVAKLATAVQSTS